MFKKSHQLFWLNLLILFCINLPLQSQEIIFKYTVIDSQAVGHRKVADINNDGLNDIVAAVHEDHKSLLVWYESPSWRKHVMTVISDFDDYPGYRSCDMEPGDIDGDGDVDVAGRIGLPHPNNEDGVDCWFENPAPNGNPAQDIWQRHDLSETDYVKDVELVDLNNDGKLDIVTRSTAHKLHIHLQQKNADSWKDIVLNIPGHDGMATGDIDRDGDPDLILNGFWIETPDELTTPWEKHDFDDKWYSQHTGDEGRWFDNNTKVAVNDMNSDGRLDIIIAMAETKGFPVCWYEAPVDPVNGEWLQHIIGYMDCCHSLNVADFDNDGDPDVMAAELGITEAPFPVVMFVNQGNSLKWLRQELSNKGNYSAAVGDIGNDGDVDIIGLRKYNAPPIEMWENLTADGKAPHIKKVKAVKQRYFLPLKVSTGQFHRFDKPVELKINFTDMLRQLKISEAIDLNSLKLVETGADETILNDAIVFQFEKSEKFDDRKNATGTLIFMLTGYTPANSDRNFRLYFDTGAGRYKRPDMPALVSLEEVTEYEGESAYKITTPQGIYFYHKRGSGFASLIDVNGNDWVSYHPEGGSAGNYRGIPNLAYDGAGEFHPGRPEGNRESKIISSGPVKFSIRSESKDGKWGCIWDIYPAYATMTLFKKGDKPYWILYEGTPGGKLDVAGDFWVNSAGERRSASQDWVGELPDPEWVYFGDTRLGRVLYYIHHEDNDAADQFWQMQQNMTVFGFGREYRCCEKYLTAVPAHLTIGFAENNDFEEIKKVIESAYKPLTISVGAPEKQNN